MAMLDQRNSCSANSALQLALGIPGFAETVCLMSSVDGIAKRLRELICEMTKTCQDKAVSAAKLLKAVEVYYPHYNGHSQEDASMFFRDLISLLDQDLDSSHPRGSKQPKLASRLGDSFTGEETCIIRCSTCKSERINSSEFRELSVSVTDLDLKFCPLSELWSFLFPETFNVIDGLELNFQEEEILEGKNAVHCGQ